MLRSGFRPKVTAWLLILSLPMLLAITQITSLGSSDLPVAFGWALAGSRLLASRVQPSKAGELAGRPGGNAVATDLGAPMGELAP